MKGHRLRWHPVNLPLRHRNPLKNTQRMLLHIRRKLARLDQLSNLPMTPPMLMLVLPMLMPMPTAIPALMRVRMRMSVRMRVLVLMPVLVRMLMRMRVLISRRPLMRVPTAIPIMRVFVPMFMPVLMRLPTLFHMRRPFMNPKLHPANALPRLPLKVHVKISQRQLRQLPLQCRRLHPQIHQRSHRHIATNSRETIKKENFHF